MTTPFDTPRFLLAALVSVCVLQESVISRAADPAQTTERAFKTHVLTRTEFDELLRKPEGLLIIDVRRPDEIGAKGGFPVYLNVPAEQIEQRLEWIPRERAIVTVSNHANRSGKAADVLARNGFKVLGTIGAQVYESDGGKLSKITPQR